jgi:hypothetical protein
MKLILNSNLRILNSKCNNSEIKKNRKENRKGKGKGQGSKEARKKGKVIKSYKKL